MLISINDKFEETERTVPFVSRNLIENEILALEKSKNQLTEVLGENLVTMKLFGSKARSNFNNQSDLDVLLILNKINPKIRDEVYDIILDIELTYDSKISLIIFSEHEYKINSQIGSPFIKNVEREGFVL